MKEVLPGWLMVKVKNRAFRIMETRSGLYIEDFGNNGNYLHALPPGSYEIVGIVTEVSEEGMVAVARSNGFEPERTILLKKKV